MALFIIIDLTFIHERPRVLATYWCIGGTFVMAAVAVVPTVTQHYLENNWRGAEWVWLAMAGLSLVASLFFLPETYFVRPAVAYDGKVLIQSAGERVHIYDEGQVNCGRPMNNRPRWGARVSWDDAWACYPQILLCMINPLHFWMTLLNSLNLTTTTAIVSTFPGLLAAPPYSQTPFAISMVGLAGAGGALFAWPTCGLLISTCIHGFSRRNRGVRHAEYYLPAFILPIIAGSVGLLLYGIGYERKLASSAFVYVSYALSVFSFMGSSVASTLWVTEAFPQVSIFPHTSSRFDLRYLSGHLSTGS